MKRARGILVATVGDFASTWRQLLAARVTYGLLAFAVLTPLVTLVLHLLLFLSGNAALSDQDILFFALHPVGAAVVIAGAALTIAVATLESAALMRIGYGAVHGQTTGFVAALIFAGRRAWALVRLAAEITGRVLLWSLPFLAVGAAIVKLLLGEYDINFYLATKPPEFWVALSLVGCLVAGLFAVLVRQFAGWVYAVPLLLFQGQRPRKALQSSIGAAAGHRRRIVAWLVAWIVASALLSAAAAGIGSAVGNLMIPRAAGSVHSLVLSLGVVMLFGSGAALLVSFLSVSSLNLLIVRLYREAGLDTAADRVAADGSDTSASPGKMLTTSRMILCGCALGAILAGVASWLLIRELRIDDHAVVMAHRGASAAAPENTLAAVERAIVDQADWVEIDVQETRDGEVVVIHDSDMNKVGNINLKVADSTYRQLAAVDIGSWFAPEFAAERIPTLRQVLETCKGKCGVNIELKHYGPGGRLEERVVEIVESTGMTANVVLMSLKADSVAKIRELRPSWEVGLLTSVTVGNVMAMDVDFFALNAGFATRSFVRRAHNHGKKVIVWTVNDVVGMSGMLSMGVDGIITDEPARAVSVLEQRAELSPAERLLVQLASFFGKAPQYLDQ